jgi:hypothetical protein
MPPEPPVQSTVRATRTTNRPIPFQQNGATVAPTIPEDRRIMKTIPL